MRTCALICLFSSSASCGHGNRGNGLSTRLLVVAITCSTDLLGFYGTGTVLSDDGLILNITVVPANARNVQVYFLNGQTASAEVVETNKKTEASFIRLDNPKSIDLCVIPLANSMAYNVGDPVYT